MKKLVLITLALGSIVAHAQSTNFGRLDVNTDGTVSLNNPGFRSPNGENLPLSDASNLNGACKLYGQGTAVPSGTIGGEYGAKSQVVLDYNGFFSAYREGSSIKTLMCKSRKVGPAPTAFNIFHNDDGSVSISGPRFMVGGMNLTLSDASDLNGACYLFGFGTAVASGTIGGEYGAKSQVVLDYNGRFNSFREGSSIKILMCRPY